MSFGLAVILYLVLVCLESWESHGVSSGDKLNGSLTGTSGHNKSGLLLAQSFSNRNKSGHVFIGETGSQMV